jgi:hypothetical protein
LDGTLALTEHRQHILADKTNPHRWQQFFAACKDDKPNWPVIETMHELMRNSKVMIWSGRSDEVRRQTIEWLLDYTHLWPTDMRRVLRMRDKGDHTPDEELKASWLGDMDPMERKMLRAVFDDRDKVVAMWRSRGIPCFQVATGAF